MLKKKNLVCELRILNDIYFRKQNILKIGFKLLTNIIIIIIFVSISTIIINFKYNYVYILK